MKRVLALIAVVASLVVAASPVMAAETFHWRASGNGMEAFWSNVQWDEGENLAPATYTETWLMASTRMSICRPTTGC